MVSDELFERVVEEKGEQCIVCGRSPEEWLEAEGDDGYTRSQEDIRLHHVNGDDTDDRVENLIPVCQSCHVHIHRVDRPPYRKWHRQLPREHRHRWNQHSAEYYEGDPITAEEAEEQFSDEEGTPESAIYRKRERNAE